jgi:hypothetical protein
MKIKKAILVVVSISALLLSCSKVYIPPAVELADYQTIGIIKFNCNEAGYLDGFVTQKFIQEITRDQKLVEILELGSESEVLVEVAKTALNIDAYKAIGEKYNLNSIIVGDIDISDIQPEINFAPGFSFVGVRGVIEANLVARMIETANGATIWTGSAIEKREIGHVSYAGGHFMFDARDPEQAYGPLTVTLVRRATKDFKETYKWKRSCL